MRNLQSVSEIELNQYYRLQVGDNVYIRMVEEIGDVLNFVGAGKPPIQLQANEWGVTYTVAEWV